VSLCPWERYLMLFLTLGPSSLPVVVSQPDERHANRLTKNSLTKDSFCVGVVWQTQSIVQHLAQTKKNEVAAQH